MLLTSLLLLLAAADSTASPADSAATHRIVRRFETVEVQAPALDLRANTVAHPIPEWTLRSPLLASVADALALQPGVVVQAGEAHVRGGRAGETLVSLDDFPLNEPIRNDALQLPVLGVAGADLVSGAPAARYLGSLAGQLDLHTVNPSARPTYAWRWRSDGRLDTHYDQISARGATPLPFAGLGVVAAGDAVLDDTSFPALRTQGRHRFLGLSLGWRAENRLLGLVKVAPVASPGRMSLQVFADRGVHMPFDPAWTLDGWTYVPPNQKDAPRFFDHPDTSTTRYRAADHDAITDARKIGALWSLATQPGPLRGRIGVSWLRDGTVTSISGLKEPRGETHRAFYRYVTLPDKFHVVWGDYPTYRESASNVWTLAAEGERARGTSVLSAGAGVRYEEARLFEQDWEPIGKPTGGVTFEAPLDTIRQYHAWAPGGWAFGQAHWEHEGMLLNGGLRAEYWTPGPQAKGGTIPWDGHGALTLSPRLGIVFPISTREAISFAYVRLHQAPDRDLLYDDRLSVNNRTPLGNPNLKPSTVISYEAALKHLIDARWTMQASVFYRDIFHQPGVRDFTTPEGPLDLRYSDEDEGHASGFEWTLTHSSARARFTASYTWMQAWGNESRSEGDPYGAIRDVRTAPIDDRPLHWDREHSIILNGAWGGATGWRVDWTSMVGSPLPWTPKPTREAFTDLAAVNSARLDWIESTSVAISWTPPHAAGLRVGLEAENLFDGHGEILSTTDGYPNPVVNTAYDDYSAYRTATGQPGGAYWATGLLAGDPHWVPLHDPRLFQTPRTIRAMIGTKW